MLRSDAQQEGLTGSTGGKIKALVYGAPILRHYINNNYTGSLKVLPHRFQRQKYGIALAPKSPRREKINAILLKKIREKAWPEKFSQYLGD